MPPHRCSYIWCENTSDKKSMFRFPWNNRRRLNIWLNNCGNKTIDHLPPEQLRSRYLCVDHFNEKYIKNINKGGKKMQRLIRKTAVPEPYNVKEIENESSYKPDRPRLPPKYDARLDSALTKNIELESAKLDNKAIDNNDAVLTSSTSKSDKLLDDNHFDFKCNFCEGGITGFRYTCVQCEDVDLCGACEARKVHATHYVLRIPGPRPQEEVCRMLSAVREAVARALFRPGLPVDVPEPEIVNPEIKEDVQDPLNDNPNWRPHETNILEDTVLEIPLKEEPDEFSDIRVPDEPTASDMDTGIPELSSDLENIASDNQPSYIKVEEYFCSDFKQTVISSDNRPEKPSNVRVKDHSSSDVNCSDIRPDEPVDNDIRVTFRPETSNMFNIETEMASKKESDTSLCLPSKRGRKNNRTSTHHPTWQELNTPPIIVMVTQPEVVGCASLPSSLQVPSSSSLPSLSSNHKKVLPKILRKKTPSSNTQKTRNLSKKPPIILNRLL